MRICENKCFFFFSVWLFYQVGLAISVGARLGGQPQLITVTRLCPRSNLLLILHELILSCWGFCTGVPVSADILLILLHRDADLSVEGQISFRQVLLLPCEYCQGTCCLIVVSMVPVM